LYKEIFGAERWRGYLKKMELFMLKSLGRNIAVSKILQIINVGKLWRAITILISLRRIFDDAYGGALAKKTFKNNYNRLEEK